MTDELKGTQLTNQEKRVIALMAAGMTLYEIGDTMDISTSAVAQYLTRARRRLGARNGPQLVAIAISQGLLVP